MTKLLLLSAATVVIGTVSAAAAVTGAVLHHRSPARSQVLMERLQNAEAHRFRRRIRKATT